LRNQRALYCECQPQADPATTPPITGRDGCNSVVQQCTCSNTGRSGHCDIPSGCNGPIIMNGTQKSCRYLYCNCD
jgi:hypothetical protein